MIVVITGPTGSGKTKLAVELAKKIDAEIINADAFQIYKELSIATAKPTKEEMRGIAHHLLDFVELTDRYDISKYQQDARQVIEDISSRNKNIIIAGGTGLYIRAALFDFTLNELPKVDMSKYEQMNDDDLYNELIKIDPETAKIIHKNNRVRVLRAIEIFLATGKKKSEIIGDAKPSLLYPAKFYEVDYPREFLYPHVEERVEKMFSDGIINEVSSLVKKYGKNCQAFSAIGVKEFFPYFDGLKTIDEVKQDIKDATRHYIKRQETFFAHQFNAKKIKSVDDILKDIYE